MFPKTQTDKDLMLVAGHMENCIIQWDGRRFSIWGYNKIVDMNNNKITPTDEALRKIQAGLDIINKKLFMIKESKSGNQ